MNKTTIIKKSANYPAISFIDYAPEFLQNYKRHWKPRTYEGATRTIEKVLMPFFGDYKIADIIKADVVRWFASLNHRTGTANASLPILSVMMGQAELYGYRPENSNPCRNISRYKRAKKERYLSPDELARLGLILTRYSNQMPKVTKLIKLLLLTGCRKSELLTAKWEYIRDSRLCLPDSKTGAKTVPLAPKAMQIINSIERQGVYIFSDESKGDYIRPELVQTRWGVIRKSARLDDVRLHDLRHTFASVAVQQKVHIVTVSRLLGHARTDTTLRYAHFADCGVASSVHSISSSLAQDLGGHDLRGIL